MVYTKEKAKEYYQKNRESCLEYRRNYRKKNINKEKEYMKGYYKKHKKEMILQAFLWHKQNPEKSREHSNRGVKKFIEKNPARFRELMKKTYLKNRKRNYSRRRTLIILNRNNTGISLTKECRSCGKVRDLEIHHEIYPTDTREIIKAVQKGKIYYLCHECHVKTR